MFRLGSLTTLPASQRPDLVGPPTLASLQRLGWLETVGVVEIDPEVSDTAKSHEKYGLAASTLANCVVVGGRREGDERLAACVVLFTTRADVNGVSAASPTAPGSSLEATAWHGGSTPLGLTLQTSKGDHMAFVQIIEMRTSQPAEMRKVGDEWEHATEGKRKAVRRVLCQDRDNPGRYFNIVFFNSYEEAMQNSSLPETDALAKKMMGFAEGRPIFYNLDVEDDRSG